MATTTTFTSNADNSTADVATRSYFQKAVNLRDWWLIKSEQDFDGKRLGVAGLTSEEKQAMRMFFSAPIKIRYEPLTLETVDGIFVRLRSRMDEVRTKENGFPSEVFSRFVFGFPTNWEEYAEKCLGEELSTKDVSTTLGRNVLSTDSGSVDDSNDGTPERNKADVSEMHGTTDKVDLCSEEKGHHKPQDGACNDSLLEDPKLRFSQVMSEMIIDGASKGFDLQNHVADCFNTVETESRVGASIESPLPKTSDVDAAHIHKTTSSRNLKSSGKRSDTPEMNNKITVSPEEESLPTGIIVEGVKISEISKNTIKDTMECKNNLRNAAINGERKSGRRSTSIPSGVGLQPTDGKIEQVDGNIASKAGRQSKNTSKTLRSSVRLSDMKKIADFQIAGSKKEKNVQNASKSKEKTNRKLTYESPETKGETEKTSFVSPESSSFRRSRSGRLLLQPLEFWRNQKVIYDKDHKITGIQGLGDVEPSGGFLPKNVISKHGSRSEPQRKRGRHR